MGAAARAASSVRRDAKLLPHGFVICVLLPFCGSGRSLWRQYQAHHVQGLLWRRAAAPNRIERWRLVRDFRPALAGHVPDFRTPVRGGGRLDADELFLQCSCHSSSLLVRRQSRHQAEARDAQISFKIPNSTKRALDAAARQDKRSISSMAMVILEAWLKERGFLK
jgi:hypothetical protein